MADIRPFRALRFDAARVDPARTIAPPYDVISPDEQRGLYARSDHNIVRIEYGETRATDAEADNRYTRAARDLRAWRDAGILVADSQPALYAYGQGFEWDGRRHERHAVFGVVRLEEWDKGIIKPHERTLSGPKTDRLHLLRATRTQVSPVYSLFRERDRAAPVTRGDQGKLLYQFAADGQQHALRQLDEPDHIRAFGDLVRNCAVYIADGHHRFETALAYRNEVRDASDHWTGDEPENFVLMALTAYDDPGLLVLPTHRLVHLRATQDLLDTLQRDFEVEALPNAMADDQRFQEAMERLEAQSGETSFLALGLRPGEAHLLTLKDRARVEQRMPESEPEAWKRLDVNVLQYAIFHDVLRIDEAELAAGSTVSYTQDAREARNAVRSGAAQLAFLLNATPVEQVLAVADAGARMPQKSTYFYPKLPTGLVMHAFGP
jgi:uncharacterized protein (DUF1015 family)